MSLSQRSTVLAVTRSLDATSAIENPASSRAREIRIPRVSTLDVGRFMADNLRASRVTIKEFRVPFRNRTKLRQAKLSSNDPQTREWLASIERSRWLRLLGITALCCVSGLAVLIGASAVPRQEVEARGDLLSRMAHFGEPGSKEISDEANRIVQGLPSDLDGAAGVYSVIIVGKGAKEVGPPAMGWLRASLRHPSKRIAEAAAAWYMFADKDWDQDQDIRREVLEALTPGER